MALNNSVTVDIRARADQASFKEVRRAFEQTIQDLELKKTEAITKNRSSSTISNINSEIKAVHDLQQAYQNAYSEKYNAVNATEFKSQLKMLGLTENKLSAIKTGFNRIGPEGTRAFKTIAANIMTANTQLEKTHTIFHEMAKTMGNTIKWGISSSIMNNFTGAVSEAYGYVKNLDKSLNDIRIVSNKSAKEMENFAVHANKAAQALGASTLDYTNAALIYYQQGLAEEQVTKMTDITVKMSNVLGTSAEEVSNYMTAIWNNFDDGSHSLEYYADVLTALGAATASSAEEISTGLEKFAAIADATGLSYEYATAALTTVTAKTRQSAEVVGTAFKTLFARIQDLELGNTLDDGTTLGKYSEALYKVGINIKDSNGQLKDMDEILSEMGKKWDTLGEAEKVALAQTVAGVRQYNQLMALMENWDYFQENLQTARNATGTLVDQQEIYMESTEAHLESAEAAWEDFKDSLIDDSVIKFFADLSKITAKFGTTLVDSIGGGLPALSLLGGTALKSFSADVGKTMFTTVQNLGMGKEGKQTKQARQDEKEMSQLFKELGSDPKGYDKKFLEETEAQVSTLNKHLKHMDDAQIQNYKAAVKERMIQQAIVDEWQEKVKIVKEFYAQTKTGSDSDLRNLGSDNIGLRQSSIEALSGEAEELLNKLESVQSRLEQVRTANVETPLMNTLFDPDKVDSPATKINKQDFSNDFSALQEERKNVTFNWKEFAHEANNLASPDRASVDAINSLTDEIETYEKELQKLQGTNKKTFDPSLIAKYRNKIDELKKVVKNAEEEIVEETKEINKFLNTADGKQAVTAKQNVNKLNTELKETKDDLEKISKYDAFAKVTGSAMQLVSSVNAGANVMRTLRDDTLTTGEKTIQMFTSMIVMTTSLVSGFKGIKEAIEGVTGVSIGFKDVINFIKNPDFSGVGEQWEKFQQHVIKVAQAKETAAQASKKAATAEKTLQAAQAATTTTATAAAAGETALAGGTAAAGGAAAAATAPTMTFSAALWSICWPVLAVVAALAVLAAAIYAVVKVYNAEADAARAAAKEAEDARAAADEAAASYENLKTKLTEYQDAVDTMKKLSAGTDEYREALEKANQAIIDLIKSDRTLAKYVKKEGELYVLRNEKGEDVTEEVLAKSKTRAETWDSVANMAQVNANKTSLTSQRRQALRDSGLSRKDEVYSAVTFASTGNLPVGLYQAGNAAFNSLTDAQLQTVLQTIIDDGGVLLQSSLEKLDFLNKSEIKALMDNKTSLENLAKSTDELNATNKLLIAESMANSLENNKEYAKMNDKQKNVVSSLYSEGYTEEKEAAKRKELKDKWYKDKAFGGGNEDAVHARYAEIMGYELAEDKSGDKAVFVDKNGKEVTVNDDSQRATIVNYELQQEMAKYDSNNLNKITKAVNSVDTSSFDKEYGFNLSDVFYDAVVTDGSKIDFSSMYANISPEEFEKLYNYSGEDWKKALGLTDEELKTLGITSVEQLQIGAREGLKDWQWDPDAALGAVLQKDGRTEDLEEKDLDPTAVKEYAKHLMEMSDESDKLADSMEHDAEAGYIVAKSIMRMNKGISSLSENFDEWNDVLTKSDKSSQEYHDALSGMQTAMSDLLDTEEEYVTDSFIQSHMEDIEKAANGDADAIDRLHKELAKDIVFNVATDADMTQAEIDALVNRVENLEIPDIEAGVKLDGTDEYAKELMKIVQDSKMTAEQAKAFFGQMGFDAQFETTTAEVDQMVPITKTEAEIESLIPFRMTSSTYQDGFHTVKQKVEVPSLSTTDGKDPKITLTKKADGAMNNASSINKGGKKKTGSKPKKVDLTKAEKDIYHDINIELQQISNKLEKVTKEQRGLVGSALIENLAEQYALLNKQIEKTAEKIRIAEGEAAGLQSELAAAGVTFNADGTIANYAEAFDKQLAKLNAVERKYNSMSASQQEAYQETLDKAKEAWEEFLNNIDRYDAVLTEEIPGMMSEIHDIIGQQVDLKLQSFEYEIKLRLDLSEAKREWEEFKADILEGKDLDNDPLAAAQLNKDKMNTYFNEAGNGSLQATTAHINKIMEQLAQMDANQIAGIYGGTYTYTNSKGEEVEISLNDREKALEDLKTYIDENIGGLTEFNELMGDIYGNYVDLLGKIQEGFDKQTEAFDILDSMIQHDMELIKMAYGEEAYDKLSELYDKDLENSKTKLAALGVQVDYWKKEVADQRAYVATLEEGTDEWFRATEALTAAEESLNGAIDAESQAVLDTMQIITDQLLNDIDEVFSKLNKSLTDGLGLGYASMEWELIGKSADEYLDTVNAIYSTQQLQNKYLDAIEKSSNPAHQKKLNDLMEQETKYLREQDKLSQYDLDRANLKYELALKQIALEEAQQNKSKLRLRRDSQGNYTYQYTADDDQVASVQQEINDLYNQLYNLDADEYRGNLEKIYDIWAEAQEKMKEAAQINDPDVRKAYELKIEEEYGALINGLVEKNENLKSNLYQSTMSQLLELYNTDTANYEQMTEEQKAILDEYITAETELNGAAFDNMFNLYNENIVNLQSMADEQKDILMTSIVPQWDSAYQKMTDAIIGEGGFENTLKVAFEQISNMAKTAFEELEKYETEYRERSDDNKNYIQDQLTSAEKLLKIYQDDLPEIKTLIAGLAEAWDKVTESIGLATTAANDYYTKTQEKNADDAADTDQPGDTEGGNEDGGQPENDGTSDTGTGGNTDTGSNDKPSLTKGSTIKLKAGTKWYGNSYGGGGSGSTSKQKSVTITLVNENGSHPYHVNKLGWVRKKDIVGYASGGYTGDWAGSDGRLAMLHKKELILNAHDTDNMLDAITILRDITSNLGATLLNRMASINASGIGALGAAGATAGLEQMVTINAEFPNVTNSHEIEDAINNLVNRASQHIHKN